MYFIKKFIKVFTALYLTTNYCLASPFRNENENEAQGLLSLSSLSGSTAMHLRRSSLTVPAGKKEKNMKENVQRILNKATRNNLFSRVLEDDDCCGCSSHAPSQNPTSATSMNPTSATSMPTSATSMNPSESAVTETPTANPTYTEKKFVPWDSEDQPNENIFGCSCSMTDDLVVIGAMGDYDYNGAAYLFRLDGTEVSKLEPGGDRVTNNLFGTSVSIDEKVVVGTGEHNEILFFRVFSLDGVHEKTLTCDECERFGMAVATHGDIIVTNGSTQDSTWKLYIYSTDGESVQELEQGSNWIHDVAISEKFIVSTAELGKTIVYSNVAPDFPLITEIEQGGLKVAVAGEKLVIGNRWENDSGGAVWLYNTDGELIKELESSVSKSFGTSVAITEQYVLVGAEVDLDSFGSFSMYSSIDGELIEKVLASASETESSEFSDYFGSSVCVSDTYYLIGQRGDNPSGAAYLFNLPS